MDMEFEVTFLGTGGSCAYNNGRRKKYGSNTPCVAVKAGTETIIFDAGSGIGGFAELNGYHREHMHIFLSHYHVDHISGLLFFSPFFDNKKKIDIYGSKTEGGDIYGIIDSFLSEPFHPVGIKSFGARCGFYDLKSGDSVMLSKEVTVKTIKLSHPGGVMGYRVEYGGKSLCYCTDMELGKHREDRALLKFAGNADLLIVDTFFNEDDTIEGWGHSGWREAAEFAKLAAVGKLALFHYKFALSDTDIDDMEEKAREVFPNTFASVDHMQVTL